MPFLFKINCLHWWFIKDSALKERARFFTGRSKCKHGGGIWHVSVTGNWFLTTSMSFFLFPVNKCSCCCILSDFPEWRNDMLSIEILCQSFYLNLNFTVVLHYVNFTTNIFHLLFQLHSSTDHMNEWDKNIHFHSVSAAS